MDDLLREFLTESQENLLRLENEIVLLEQTPDDKDLLGSIFRSMHTIKGTCGFLGLERLESVAHSAENVLGALRDGTLSIGDAMVSDILASIDVIRDILEGLEATEAEPEGDDTALIGRLDAWLEGEGGGNSDAELDALFAAAMSAPESVEEAVDEPIAVTDESHDSDDSAPELSDDDLAAAFAEGASAAPASANVAPELAELMAEADRMIAEQKAAKAAARASAGTGGYALSPEMVKAGGTTTPAEAKVPETKDADARRGGGRSVAESTLRVDVDVLDLLMNLAGELVLTRNQLMQLAGHEEDSSYATPVQQLNRVTTDLQEAVMRTRMQPIGNAWGKLPRLVRDLASASGKQIDLEMIGQETELDRQILQAIRDPLTHMIRNSADHGIESVDVRTAAGKPAAGRIELEAFHEGGHIVIEIRDDGKGIDVEAVRSKAIERGLTTSEEASHLPDHRIFDFIFEAGFSTAKQVTNVSGRGVGMDVVRRNIEQIGGSIEIHSEVGQGSVFRIKIPLTLAIMSALIVGSGGLEFAVPQIGVLELVRISEENRKSLEDVNGAAFYRLRDTLLPLVRLDHVLGLVPFEKGRRNIQSGSIVVCQVGVSRFGLVVDRILDTQEIVVKPVGRMVKGVKIYAGTTILGDGSVIMILDVPGIATEADMLDRSKSVDVDAEALAEATNGESFLLFDAGVDAPRAIPLDDVSRLEEVPVDEIEWAAGRWVVQYRGHLLPLVAASDRIGMRDVSPRNVIVIGDGAGAFGIAVDEIRDIVRQRIEIRSDTDQAGLVGTAVVAGRTTEIIDVDDFRARAGVRSGVSTVRNRIAEGAFA